MLPHKPHYSTCSEILLIIQMFDLNADICDLGNNTLQVIVADHPLKYRPILNFITLGLLAKKEERNFVRMVAVTNIYPKIAVDIYFMYRKNQCKKK